MQLPTAVLPAATAVAGPAVAAEHKAFAVSTTLGIVGVGLELARPWPLALAVDYAFAGRPLVGLAAATVLTLAALAVVALTAVAGLVDMAADVAAERAAERIGARLRQRRLRPVDARCRCAGTTGCAPASWSRG